MLAIRLAEHVRRFERGAVPHRDQGILKTMSRALVVVDVAGRDGPQPQVQRQADQLIDPAGITPNQIVLELEKRVLGAEAAREAPSGLGSLLEPAHVEEA